MKHSIMKRSGWRGRIIRYAPLVFWTLVVLGFSTGVASSEETSIIIRPILKFFFPLAPDASIDLYHAYIRKCAHFGEYGILSLLAFRAAAGSSLNALRQFHFIFPVIFVTAIASIDEYHQSFVPSRTSSPWDVLLDISGGLFAVFLCWLAVRKRS